MSSPKLHSAAFDTLITARREKMLEKKMTTVVRSYTIYGPGRSTRAVHWTKIGKAWNTCCWRDGDPESVFVLFVRRLVGLMLIAVAFPLGSRVNNEADVGGPAATPHIPPASPLREKTHTHTSWTEPEVVTKQEKRRSWVVVFHQTHSALLRFLLLCFACRTLEKIGWFWI